MNFGQLEKAVIKLNASPDAIIFWELERSGSSKTEVVYVVDENRLYITDSPEQLLGDIRFTYDMAKKEMPTIRRYKV